MVARIRVEQEEESARGWSYAIVVERGGAAPSRHVLTLSFADYEHWVGGRIAPSVVAERLVEFVLDRRPEPLPERFDGSTARRWVAGLDEHLKATSAPW